MCSQECGVAYSDFGGLTSNIIDRQEDQLELLDDPFGATTVARLFGYGRGFGLPSTTDCEDVRRLMNV